MKVSNRVKRNISFSLLMLGCAITVARAWEVVMCPESGRAWFNLFSIIFLTCFCFSSLRQYNRRLKRGILFGPETRPNS